MVIHRFLTRTLGSPARARYGPASSKTNSDCCYVETAVLCRVRSVWYTSTAVPPAPLLRVSETTTRPTVLKYLVQSKDFVLTCYFSIFFNLISLIADGPHHYHPACGHKGSSHLSPVHALQLFYRDASSALLQLVNQWLDFTYSRSHAFRYERKITQILFW